MAASPIRFATFLAPNMLPVYQFIASHVGQKLNRPTELVVGPPFEQFASCQADVSFICGLPYVLLTRDRPAPVEPLATPVLYGERFQNRPIYYSDVIVLQDSPFQSFGDLRGASWAYNEPYSQSGYGITRYALIRLGQTRGFFGRTVEAGMHQKAIRMVYEGQVDASAIDCQVLAVELRDHPELASQLRVIEALGPSTIQPVVAASRLPDSLKADIQAVLLEMGKDEHIREQLAGGFVERFAPIGDTDYDDIREMLAASEAAGFMHIH